MRTKEDILEDIEYELVDIEDYADSIISCRESIEYLLEELKKV